MLFNYEFLDIFKDYEASTNIYDVLEEDGFSENIQHITETEDMEQLETLLS